MIRVALAAAVAALAIASCARRTVIHVPEGGLATGNHLVANQRPGWGTLNPGAPIDTAALTSALLDAVNEARADQGLSPLIPEPALTRAATRFSAELAERNVLSHESIDPARTHLEQRIAAENIALTRWSENLAWMPDSPDELPEKTVRAWLGSPDHRANLLASDVTHTGIGVVLGEDGHWYVVEVFGRPYQTVDPETVSVAQLEQHLVGEANAARREAGLAPLTIEPLLSRAAQRYSVELATTRAASGVGGVGRPGLLERASYEGLTTGAIAENVLWLPNRDDTHPRTAMRIWLGSPPHRANELDAKFTMTGVGVTLGEDRQWYIVQLIAAPRP